MTDENTVIMALEYVFVHCAYFLYQIDAVAGKKNRN